MKLFLLQAMFILVTALASYVLYGAGFFLAWMKFGNQLFWTGYNIFVISFAVFLYSLLNLLYLKKIKKSVNVKQMKLFDTLMLISTAILLMYIIATFVFPYMTDILRRIG